jgi:hypothetical protein
VPVGRFSECVEHHEEHVMLKDYFGNFLAILESQPCLYFGSSPAACIFLLRRSPLTVRQYCFDKNYREYADIRLKNGID